MLYDETTYIDFIKSSLNYQLAELENECYLSELVKNCYYSWTCCKHNKTKCRFSDVWFLTDHLRLEKVRDLEKNFPEKLFLMMLFSCCYFMYVPAIVLPWHYHISSF